MGKYFCRKCKNLTFSLRYMTQGKWQKPKGHPQYCSKCDLIELQKNCVTIGGEL